MIEDLISAIQRAAEYSFKAREKAAAPVLAAMGGGSQSICKPARSAGVFLRSSARAAG